MKMLRPLRPILCMLALATGAAGGPCHPCTLVIGYSQVGQSQGGWFVTPGGFLDHVDPAHWQLLWNPGAGVDRWRNPDYPGWNTGLVSPCSQGAATPQRVLLSISGPYGTNEEAWIKAIEETIDNIRAKYPSASKIILQPVVGGPGGQSCQSPSGGGLVRASWQHNHIASAIEVVATRQSRDVIAGFRPQVRTCADYSDALGHLTPEGAAAAGAAIAEYYLSGAATYANCDRSHAPPVLNVDDFTCFVNAFATAQSLTYEEKVIHYANCDGSTAEPILTVDDFTCFINAFATGCP